MVAGGQWAVASVWGGGGRGGGGMRGRGCSGVRTRERVCVCGWVGGFLHRVCEHRLERGLLRGFIRVWGRDVGQSAFKFPLERRTLFNRMKDVQGCSAAPADFSTTGFLGSFLFPGSQRVCVWL